jgi:4-hydroxyphenylacetate 3-hydroxylase, reductase component
MTVASPDQSAPADASGVAVAPPVDARKFRTALGRFATGVTIVTARDGQGVPVGLTANSFSSLSLDPPLVLWSLNRSSSLMPVFAEVTSFVINILADDQVALSRQFARSGTDRFADVAWHDGVNGTPVIEGCAAWFDCRIHSRLEGGDHVIFVGQVDDYAATDLPPLLYVGGHYARAAHHPDATG